MPAESSEDRKRLLSSPWLVAAAVFVVAFLLLLPFYLRQPTFHDADSYFHLAVARVYAEEGFFAELLWARLSLMAERFGDKEFLFHVLLMPFAALSEGAEGGRVALAFLNALIAAALAYLGIRAIGVWGALLPFFLFFTSADWVWRLTRIRAELLSLLLLLVALALIANRRYRWLAVVGAVFALSYTAFHAFFGLCFLIFLFRGWVRKRWDLQLPLYALLGVVVGLLVHPHFPDNLHVWAVQSFSYFHLKESLDVGVEILAEPTDELLLFNLGWWLGLVVIIGAARRLDRPREDTAWSDAFGVAALVFGALFLLMLRFSLYFVPFLTLALLFFLRDRGYRLTRSITLPGGGPIPVAVGLLLCLVASYPQFHRVVKNLFVEELGPREELWTEFGESVPSGARVAATWSDTHVYTFYAPQARYLNVLDPVFMAVPFPREYELQRRIFDGREPDVPFVTATLLDSDHLAYTPQVPGSPLRRRLAVDPRIDQLHGMPDLLVKFRPDANEPFVLDWHLLSPGGEPDGLYPRAPDSLGRSIEGYVDANRIQSPAACQRFLHLFQLDKETRSEYEFAPFGPSSLWVNGEGVVRTAGDLEARLGEGLRLPLELAAGENSFLVETCRSARNPEYAGFYLLERIASGN
ncbi:MAG: hypothetical protein EP299_10820 [Acidobacteria bacterium]|nr:MAG: hypothetical protein EP299_10820 [Acidobacteriota bacterium]